MVQLPGPPPTVDDLRENLSAIFAEEELKRHDSPPDPPLAQTPPCKCTLVAHETCLVHWIKARQHDSGHSRGELKCPQCGQLHEFEGVNPAVLRILNALNGVLSGSASAIRTWTRSCPANITALPFVAVAAYLACVAYGAFAVRIFLGPDAFHALLTSNPTRWPWHAWINLPLIPLLLVASSSSAPPRNDDNPLLFALALLGSSSPLVLWTASPLIPLLYPWPATAPVAAGPRGLSPRPSAAHPPLWPPHPTLVCVLFPVVRALYGRLRDWATQMAAERDEDDQREGTQQQHRPPAPPAAARAGHPFPFPIGDRYLAEVVHFFLGRNAPAPTPAGATSPAADATAPAPDNPAAADQQSQPPTQERAPRPRDANDLCAQAARAMRMAVPATSTRAALRALAMPVLAWAMGDVLLSISRIDPLVRPLIAVRPRPPRSAPSLVGWLAGPVRRLFGAGAGGALLRGFGGFLAMSDAWVASDPVWWRNTLGFGLFFVVSIW
ncbi:hypothetical protein BC826DRAFT_735073 [Russula brevipes]|nr:hypothetical protein BC826DRAFT_735073 [Russula brevipes]